MTYMTSGNQTVDSMGTINITGNVIPQIWYSIITRPNGKPNLLAITLLSDIVYWYRPTEIRDEQSGRVIGWKKKFKGDTLQKTYQQYADLYGESRHSVKEAIKRLEELGVISKEFREITFDNGMILNNVMFISLNTDILYQLTYPHEFKENTKKTNTTTSGTETSTTLPHFNEVGGTENSMGYSNIMDNDQQKNIPAGDLDCIRVAEKNATPPTENKETYTETYTKITNKESINPINQGNNIMQKSNDEMDMIDAYTQIIKDNINYESLRKEMGYNASLVDEILDLLVETICVERKYIHLNEADYPYQLVKRKFLKIDYSHVTYVMNNMKKNKTKITNIRSYLLTALFNSVSTIDNHYQADANYDMYK